MFRDNPNTAKQVSDIMLEMFNRLSNSCQMVKESCSPEEYAVFLVAIDMVVKAIVSDVLEPLYESHPDLKPANWDEISE